MESKASDLPSVFRYDAFISYRHVEPDRKWAKWLHTALEMYRVPNSIVREKGAPPRLSRVFRDEEELPASSDLNNQIEQALQSSRFLIVVCSPRTPESLWVDKEVERFRELGRHDRILALLIEGEPGESFPRALREIRRNVVDASGASKEQIEEVEPLAADVRPIRRESQRHLARMARLRLMACILGVRFDDLRQREQERRARRLAFLSAAGIVLTVLMAALAVAAVLQRNEARRQRGIAEENARKENIARKQAQRRLAESLVAQTNVFVQAGRWREADDSAETAFAAFSDAAESDLPAQLAHWYLRSTAPAPLNQSIVPLTYGGGAVALSRDGVHAVAVKQDKSLAIWNLRTGRIVRELGGEGGFANDAAFTPDSTRFVTAHADGRLRIWDSSTGQIVARLGGDLGNMLSMAILDDGVRAVAGGEDHILRVWDIQKMQLIGELPRHQAMISAVAAGWKYMLSADISGRILLWDVDSKIVRPLQETGEPVYSAAVSPDGNFAVTFTETAAVLWNLKDEQHRRFINASESAGAKFEKSAVSGRTMFAPDGHAFLRRSGTDAMIQPVNDAEPPRYLSAHASPPISLLFSRDGALALTNAADKKLLLWPNATDRLSRRLAHGANIFSVGISRDGLMIVTAGALEQTKLWDAFTGRMLASFNTGTKPVIAAAVCPDGSAVAVGGDGGAWVFELPDGKRADLPGHDSGVNGITFSPDGRFIVTAGVDSVLRLFDRRTLKQLRQFTGHKHSVVAVCFSADSHSFVSSGIDGQVLLWSTDSSSPVRSFAGDQTRVRGAAISPDGRLVASGADDGTLRVWDAQNGTQIFNVAADPTAVCSVVFSSDGRLIFTAGATNAVRIWDAPSGHEWLDIRGFTQTVWSVATSQNNLCVAGCNDGYATVSDFSTAMQIRQLRSRIVAATTKLDQSPTDPDSLAVMGQWYALHGIWPWAIEYLSKAETGGSKVSPLLLARCHWQSGNGQAAKASFEKALAARETDETYLKLCIQAIDAGR